jgi:hypothetical protein
MPPSSRPPELWAGAVFLTLAAIPVGLLGALLAAQPGLVGQNLRARITDAQIAMNPDTLLAIFRSAGILVLILAVAFIGLAWSTLRPSRAARLGATALAALEIAGLIFGIVATSPDPVTIAVIVLAATGAILLFLPRPAEFLAGDR